VKSERCGMDDGSCRCDKDCTAIALGSGSCRVSSYLRPGGAHELCGTRVRSAALRGVRWQCYKRCRRGSRLPEKGLTRDPDELTFGCPWPSRSRQKSESSRRLLRSWLGVVAPLPYLRRAPSANQIWRTLVFRTGRGCLMGVYETLLSSFSPPLLPLRSRWPLATVQAYYFPRNFQASRSATLVCIVHGPSFVLSISGGDFPPSVSPP